MTREFRRAYADNPTKRQVDFDAIARAMKRSEMAVAQHYSISSRCIPTPVVRTSDESSAHTAPDDDARVTAALQRYLDDVGSLPRRRPVKGT